MDSMPGETPRTRTGKEPDGTTYKQCPECGMNMLSSIRQCPQCNHKFRSDASALPYEGANAAPTHHAGPLKPLGMETASTATMYKQCPECAMSMAVAVGQCPGCGHRFKTQFTPKPAHHTMAVACVSCGNPGVLKLSAVIDSPAEAQRVGVKNREWLAKQVALPPEPQYEAPRSFVAVAVLGVFCLLGIAAYTLTQQILMLGLGGVAGLAAAGFGFQALQAKAKAEAEFTRDATEWKEMRQRWNMLFYCAKCNMVSDLVSRDAFAPEKVQSALSIPH